MNQEKIEKKIQIPDPDFWSGSTRIISGFLKFLKDKWDWLLITECIVIYNMKVRQTIIFNLQMYKFDSRYDPFPTTQHS